MTSGIYMVQNKQTGQIYIGQSQNIEWRWEQHCQTINPLHIDIHFLGEDNFDCYILEEIPYNIYKNNKNIVNNKEWEYMQYFNVIQDSKHYNLVCPPGVYGKLKRKTPKKRLIKKWKWE